jgi:hypothetical protein
MQEALADWTPQELHELARLFHRMVDDFVAYAAHEEREAREDRKEREDQEERGAGEGEHVAPSARSRA